jgi:hypothetical protein
MSNTPHANRYQRNGYSDRRSYLRSLARDYGVSPSVVHSLADMLGASEDFDALPVQLQDWSDSTMHFRTEDM